MARQGPKELPTNFAAATFAGLAYPFEGLQFIRRHKLWGMCAVPIAVNAVLFFVLVAVTLWLMVPLLQQIDVWLTPGAETGAFLTGLMSVLSWFIWIVAILLVPVINAIVLVLLGQAVAGPFLDLLSEKVETIVLGTEPEPTTVARVLRSIVVALADIVWMVAFWLVVNIPIYVLGLVTGIGAPIAAGLSFAFTALLLTQEFAGLPLARQLVGFRKRFRVIWRNKWLSLGFGTTTTFLVLVPGLNLILLPVAAVGGALLYSDWKAAGRVDDVLGPVGNVRQPSVDDVAGP